MKKLSFFVFVFLGNLQLTFAAPNVPFDTRITIAHTNDVHGHIEENQRNKEFGYAKIATLIKQWRAENPNFLLLDAGDTFQGTVFVNLFKGESLLPILNALPYTLMAAGNHEFDYGYQQTLKLRSKLKFPMINANVFFADGKAFMTQTHFITIAGKRFAILGLVAEDTGILTHPKNVEGLIFKNPIEVARQLVPELKKQAEHVIVVSHVGLEVDRGLARQVPGIDLIVGGHSHTRLPKPEKINDTYIVQDWEYGKSLGRAELYYQGEKLVAFEGGLKEYDASVPADPAMAQLVKKVTQKINQRFAIPIAVADVLLDGSREIVRTQESNIGNWMCDALIARTQQIQNHAADVCIVNGGGIRTQIPAGTILLKHVHELFPFPNTVVVTELSGRELRKALEHGVSGVEKAEGKFPQVGGLRFSYNPKAKPGKRVREVWLGTEKLDLHKTYRLVTSDFLLAGGDGYQLPQQNSLNTGIILSTIAEEAMRAQKHLSPKVEGRIEPKP